MGKRDILMREVEIFVSNDGTQYIWNRDQEEVILLNDAETKMVSLKVSLMSDEEILNRTSGNGVPMGIPITLSKDRLIEIRDNLVQILKKGPFIDFEKHVLERLVYDALLDDNHPEKRGWNNSEEVRECVLSASMVTGVRLNVDHHHPENTEKVKHLHPNLALVISGSKGTGKGRLVLVILNEQTISVITIL
ncbi:hypothetical protein MHB42_17345 [Lysinibacillus sp. FSL K6-0232]|uniref:hypothetical protein n=1 Tax=Lysinibacillus sp. FSL K6-0232 TaxID=2921425 RepID=UPI0030F6C464